MNDFLSYLPDGYNPFDIKKIPKQVVQTVAKELNMDADSKAAAIACALTGARRHCLCCGKQTAFISYNQGFREYCSTKCLNNSKEVKQKKQQTSLDKYGTLFPTQSESTKLKIKEKLINRIAPTLDEIVHLIESQGFSVIKRGETLSDQWILKCDCSKEFSQILPTWSRWNTNFKTICPACSKGSSSQEKEIARYIESKGIEIKRRDRTKIPPLELDIFIPSKNLAIEFNGLYWHSDDKNRHLDKLLKCKSAGIKLIQIFEHDWNMKRDIIMSRINSALGLNKKIYARKTTIVTVSAQEADSFFTKYHLQSNAKGAKYYFGLQYNDELIQLISICKTRFNNKYANYELLRSASKNGITIVGGLSKLLNYALDILNEPLLTYADRCWGEGESYSKIYGKLIKSTDPSYIWWKGEKIASRYSTWKSSIKKVLGDDFNPLLGEQDNMRNNGWRQLWNAGNNVYIINKNFNRELS